MSPITLLRAVLEHSYVKCGLLWKKTRYGVHSINKPRKMDGEVHFYWQLRNYP